MRFTKASTCRSISRCGHECAALLSQRPSRARARSSIRRGWPTSSTRTIQREGPDTIVAMFVEAVMGAGGAMVPPKGYFEAITAVLDKYGIYLVDDEVICGFGRTGNAFGCQTYNYQPDSHVHRQGPVIGLSADLRGAAVAGAGGDHRGRSRAHRRALARLHLQRPSGGGGGGGQDPGDLPAARHVRPCAQGGAAFPGAAEGAGWIIRWWARREWRRA